MGEVGVGRFSAGVVAALSAALMVGASGVATAAPPVPETAPGSVLSAGRLDPELAVSGAADAERLTFRTQWRDGTSAESTGVLYVPEGPAPEGGWPVVAWAHGTTGIGDDCAPSSWSPEDQAGKYLNRWLDEGYAVVAADYPGLGTDGLHRYLDGPSAANSVVDSVRAAREVRTDLSDRWVVVGQSQGGHTALHTAQIASTRAPELDFRGTVATGAPANLELLFPLGGPDFPDLGMEGLTVYAAYIVAGMRDAYPELDLDSYLTEEGRRVADLAESLCSSDLAAAVGGIPVGELLSRPLGDPALAAALGEYLGVPTGGYDRPLFLGHGLNDWQVPAALSAKLFADLRASGTDVVYHTYDGGHVDSMYKALPDTTVFVQELFRG